MFRRLLPSAKLPHAIFFTIVLFVVLRWLEIQPKIWLKRESSSQGLKLAFATLLLPPGENGTSPPDDADIYLTSIRLLNYQLLHDKTTQSKRSIPFLVLVTPDVSSSKSELLAREGATIVSVEKFDSSWIEPGVERWRDVIVKLRLFELLDFNRILFLDADTFLFKRLDGIFDDAAAAPQRTLHVVSQRDDEGPLPNTYVFATTAEVMHTTHSYPPVPMSYFNAGFFVLAPSLELFNYFTSLFKLPGRFDTTYPEQNLLNYAHRRDGNMPWGRLFHGWNINLPNMNDVKKGVASVHAKLWTAGTELQPIEKELQDCWHEKYQQMVKYYQDKEKTK